MRTKQGTDFANLLYAKQILTQKYININMSFLRRAEGTSRKRRSRMKQFAISEKHFGRFLLRSIRVQFFYRTFGRTSKIAKSKVTSILAPACDQVTLRV